MLDDAGITLETIPAKGERVLLKPTANLSTGGTSTDVTDEVHPANFLCLNVLQRLLVLDICGIDVMAMDLRTPVSENGGAILK
jgi:cyanophycin synthetase